MNDSRNRKDQKNPPPTPPTGGRLPGGGIMLIIIAITGVLLVNMLVGAIIGNNMRRIYYSEFVAYLEAGRVESVEVQPDRIMITLLPELSELSEYEDSLDSLQSEEGVYPSEYAYTPESEATPTTGGFLDGMMFNLESAAVRRQDTANNSTIVYTGRMPDPELRAMLDYYGVRYSAAIVTTNWLQVIFFQLVLPIFVFYIIFMLLRRTMSGMLGGKGGFMSVGQSNAKVYMEKKTGVTFEDVAGQDEAKESLMEIVDFLHNPTKYTEIGAVQPKGALLVGPPGTGKTLLAKAVAGEAGVVFFSLSGSDFVEMFVGVGASRVRDLFKQASAQSPCIIFIDEIDAIGKSRDNQMNSNDEREQTLNQLLAEMDGFDSSKGVVILGATNRPEILDKALLRPGRFDRRVNVELPDLKGREDILRVHAKKVKMCDSVDLRKTALVTPGSAGADLANMVNEAALNAVRHGRKEVIQEDLSEAVEVVIMGREKKNKIMTEEVKRVVAYHEVGHALARAVQKDARPVEKITIIPRTKGALGYVLATDDQDRVMYSKKELLSEIVAALAGRAAEELKCDTQTNGASNDIQQATNIARSMVSMYGMNDKFGMMALESIQNRYLDGRAVSNVSDRTGAELDEEVRKILQECYQKAVEVLQENSDKLDAIAAVLIEKETITGDEFMELYKGTKPEDKKPEEPTSLWDIKV